MRSVIIAGLLFAIGFGVTELVASSLEPANPPSNLVPALEGMPAQAGAASPSSPSADVNRRLAGSGSAD
jgi:hypothetical protein